MAPKRPQLDRDGVPVLPFRKRYDLTNDEMSRLQIHHTGVSELPQYQDSRFSVIRLAGADYPWSVFRVERTCLPPLDEPVVWSSNLTSTLHLPADYTPVKKSRCPLLSRYQFRSKWCHIARLDDGTTDSFWEITMSLTLE